MLKKLLIGVTVVALSGCSAVSVERLIDTAYIIEANQGVVETALKAPLTDDEVTIVKEAEVSMLELKAYADVVRDNPLALTQLDSKVEDVSNKYLRARAVILKYQGEYQEFDWDGLEAANAQFEAMYSTYKSYVGNEKYQEAASQLGEYIKLGMKIAIIYGV